MKIDEQFKSLDEQLKKVRENYFLIREKAVEMNRDNPLVLQKIEEADKKVAEADAMLKDLGTWN